jgi:heme O synthase-like polyprenyltransferase
MTGSVYAIAAIAAGLGLLYFAMLLRCDRTLARARHVLLASVLYLPILLAAMVLNSHTPAETMHVSDVTIRQNLSSANKDRL